MKIALRKCFSRDIEDIKLWHCTWDRTYNVPTMLTSALLFSTSKMIAKQLVCKDATELGEEDGCSFVYISAYKWE